MSAVVDAGFSYWGLFVILGAILVGYAVWMHRVERTQGDEGRDEGAPPGHGKQSE